MSAYAPTSGCASESPTPGRRRSFAARAGYWIQRTPATGPPGGRCTRGRSAPSSWSSATSGCSPPSTPARRRALPRRLRPRRSVGACAAARTVAGRGSDWRPGGPAAVMRCAQGVPCACCARPCPHEPVATLGGVHIDAELVGAHPGNSTPTAPAPARPASSAHQRGAHSPARCRVLSHPPARAAARGEDAPTGGSLSPTARLGASRPDVRLLAHSSKKTVPETPNSPLPLPLTP